MKIIYQPTIEEIGNLLYSEGMEPKELSLEGDTIRIWVKDDHVKTLFNLLSGKYTLLKVFYTGISGNTYALIQAQKKHKWF